MKRILFLFVVIHALLFSGCNTNPGNMQHYYPFDSLLNNQVQHLARAKATLSKKAAIGEKEELKTFIPKDTLAWRHELDVFAQLNDINKPVNRGKYRIVPHAKDRNSNLLIYTLESTEKLPVSFLKVYYLETLSNIRKIEGLYRQESSLMHTSRYLSMEFQHINNKTVLTSYSMKGGQKMLLGDSVEFSIHGSITLP